MSAVGDALDRVRGVVKPEWRERIYDTVGAGVVVLGGWGLVDEADGAVIAQVILAAVALLFAILHSTSGIRTALYGLLVAVQALAGLWSIGTDAQWAGVLAMAAAVLGTQVAAGRTPILATLLAEVGRIGSAPINVHGDTRDALATLQDYFEDPVSRARKTLDTRRRDALPDPPPPPRPPTPGQGPR